MLQRNMLQAEETSMSSKADVWPLSRVVFSVLICAGYVCAGISFLLMARVIAL
jgi:hypothetical protein